MTTKQDIRRWLNEGKKSNNDYLIVVCDTFDYEDYPIYCKKSSFWNQYNSHNGVNMQKVMEVYDLSMDFEEQLNENRVFNCPPKS